MSHQATHTDDQAARRVIAVAPRQVVAARVVVAGNRQLRRPTPAWIVRLAETRQS